LPIDPINRNSPGLMPEGRGMRNPKSKSRLPSGAPFLLSVLFLSGYSKVHAELDSGIGAVTLSVAYLCCVQCAYPCAHAHPMIHGSTPACIKPKPKAKAHVPNLQPGNHILGCTNIISHQCFCERRQEMKVEAKNGQHKATRTRASVFSCSSAGHELDHKPWINRKSTWKQAACSKSARFVSSSRDFTNYSPGSKL